MEAPGAFGTRDDVATCRGGRNRSMDDDGDRGGDDNSPFRSIPPVGRKGGGFSDILKKNTRFPGK